MLVVRMMNTKAAMVAITAFWDPYVNLNSILQSDVCRRSRSDCLAVVDQAAAEHLMWTWGRKSLRS